MRWTIFRASSELATILLLFHVLAFLPMRHCLWDPSSSLTTDQTRTLRPRHIGRQSRNHWSTREVPHDGSLAPPSVPRPSPEDEGRGWKFQASDHGVVFLGPSPHLEAVQEDTTSHPIRMKDAPVTQEITRNLGAKSGTWVQDQMLEQKVLLAPVPLRKFLPSLFT